MARRAMRLTAGHVAMVHRQLPDPGPILLPGIRPATDDDYAAMVERLLATMPGDAFWLFGYGSLIWNPETAFVERRVALARGWHRRFCLGWDYRFRGNPEQPGLMLALDRGGQCKGVAYRLPSATLEEELHKLIRREMSMVPTAFPPRWIETRTEGGPVRALTFAMNRNSGRYIAGLSHAALADILARACGFRGSMAEYLLATVSQLEELGIRDRNLWRLQELVAERIEAAYPGGL
ncbi:gamma-glutamylcyclotransferase [Devosia sp.]|uniref:gamma-glutamylcyclotransferase n=1 Tax=Devosia sp. TaxID=1871048 RepID=UPI002F207C3F